LLTQNICLGGQAGEQVFTGIVLGLLASEKLPEKWPNQTLSRGYVPCRLRARLRIGAGQRGMRLGMQKTRQIIIALSCRSGDNSY